jgi:hypothetical protein
MSMPDDCDADCGDEAPDPEPGCGEDEGSGSSEGGGGGSSEGGDDTCPPGYVSCGATGGLFILDSDLEWTWVNDDGCPEGCGAFKEEQPTAEEEAAGYEVGDTSAGICCEPEPGCCKHYICANNDGVWQYVYHEDSPSDEADCTAANDSAGIGTPNSPCDADPSNSLNNYFTWSADPCPTGCCTHWNCTYNGTTYQYTAGTPYDSSEANCIMLITEFSGDPSIPCNSTPLNLNNNYNTWSAEPCIGGLSVPSDRPIEVMERPCYQEECETHVSTWMAEPSGEPNEEGLYKVKWILLDDCPGACCSDQPTQPEFVKKSELIDAPCKCGCN